MLYNLTTEKQLKLSDAFSLIVIFAWITWPVRKITYCLDRRVLTYTSAERLEVISMIPEQPIDSRNHATTKSIQRSEMILENAKFSWEDPSLKKLLDSLKFLKKQAPNNAIPVKAEGIEMKENPSSAEDDFALKNINLHIKPGSLTLIIGRVG